MYGRGVVRPLAVAGLLLWSSSAGAQSLSSPSPEVENPVDCVEGETTLLPLGSVTDGCELRPGWDIDAATFEAFEGDRVRVTIQTDSAFLDPNVEIREPFGLIVARIGCQSRFDPCSDSVDIDVTRSGFFSLFTSEDGRDGAGGYTIQVEPLFPVPLEPIEPEVGARRMPFDSEVSDTISPGTDTDKVVFNGDPDTEVRIEVDALTSSFTPRVEVRDPSGAVVADETCSSSSCDVAFTLSIFDRGDHTIHVSSREPLEEGDYDLRLDCMVGPCDADGDGIPEVTSSRVVMDDPVIPPPTTGTFRFSITTSLGGSSGTTLRINLVRASSASAVDLRVVDPAGALLDETRCAGAGTGCSVTLDVDSAAPSSRETLSALVSPATALAYELEVHCLSGDCDSDGDGLLDPAPRKLNYGQTLEGPRIAIEPSVDVDQYVFYGVAGTRVRLDMTGLEPLLDPALEVRDPSGAPLASNTCTGDALGCTFSIELDVAESGLYRLAVSDTGVDDAGAYRLGLTCAEGPCDGSWVADEHPCEGGETEGCVDNCPIVTNPDQTDVSGLLVAPDAVGDLCQCGDVNGDGAVTLGDVGRYKRWLAMGKPPMKRFDLGRCDVGGSPECDLADVARLNVSLASFGRRPIAQVCTKATAR